MSDSQRSLGEVAAALEAARDALTGFDTMLWQASEAELESLMGLADAVASRADAARVQVTVEGLDRGVFAGVTGAEAWVREHAPATRQGPARSVARLACSFTTRAGHHGSVGRDRHDPETPGGKVWAAVRDGHAGPGVALATLGEVSKLAEVVVADALPLITDSLLALGIGWGPVHLRRLRPALEAQYGRPGTFDDTQDKLAGSAFLSQPEVESGGITTYRMGLTPEQAAALEAAIGPLSAPRPNPETGEADLRPAGQRRAEALIAVIGAGTAFEAAGEPVAASRAVLHVQLTWEDLQTQGGSAVALGSRAAGTFFSPAVARRVACDADLIPIVLGTRGEVLDVGRAVRLFTRTQVRTLWHRDNGCTYPGCTAPAAWTQAHHVIHWADHGPTDLGNAALLCARHHTLVHTRRLTATITTIPDEHGRCVTWDLTPGSYDHARNVFQAGRPSPRRGTGPPEPPGAADRDVGDPGDPFAWAAEGPYPDRPWPDDAWADHTWDGEPPDPDIDHLAAIDPANWYTPNEHAQLQAWWEQLAAEQEHGAA